MKLPALSQLIREALDASTSADPADVVDALIGSIPEAQHTHYLREALTERVGSAAARMRTDATPAIRKGLSTKQSLIRDEYWPRFLRQRLFLPSGYKFLAEATADDLREAAAARQAQAQEILFRAEQFDSLASLMDNYGVKYLEELDPSVGTKVLERAA